MLSDHYPLSPRVLKVRESILKKFPMSEVTIFAWNRNNAEVNKNQEFVKLYNQNIGYGNVLKKIKNIIGYIKSVINFNKEYNATHLHIIDFSFLIFSGLISRSNRIVYEIYDVKYLKSKLLNYIREKVEVYIINKHIDSIIYASPYFEKYYIEKGIKKTIPSITLNNKPCANLYKTENIQKNKINSQKVVLGFIGTIRHTDILLNLIQAINKYDNVELKLAGDGPSVTKLKEYVEKNNMENLVKFTGRFNTIDLPILYNDCDFIWAAYPNKNMNVKYAISNKFFESRIFKKKIIVANETMIADLVKQKNIGYEVNPYSIDEIDHLISEITKDYPYNYPNENINDLFWESEESKLIKVY